jgi:hypothetical protein
MSKKILFIFLSALLIFGLFLVFYSPVIFQEGNPWSQVKGVVKLNFTNKDLVKISGEDNKYMTKSNNGFAVIKSYMEEKGYSFVEQMGSGYFFQSATGESAIATHKYYSRFYSLWDVVENSGTTNEPVNFTAREKAIEQYLLNKEYFSWKNRDDSHTFCVIENLKPDQELFPLYIWSYCGEYVIENNNLVTVSGSSVPVKIDYPNELSYYDINKFSYEVPRDGADYSKDIKRIFPSDVQQKIFDHDVDELIAKAENYAFTNIYNWNLITQAISECKIESVMQTHALEVTATFQNGEEITTREPKIDDVFDIINQHKNKCGEIIMMTE